VRRVLLNETYTGRTAYRRTIAEKVRDPSRGRWVRRVEERDESEWIEIEGATPPIISGELFARAQVRLDDPERTRRRELDAGRSLPTKIAIGSDSGDDMWSAYDTTSHPSVLQIGP
jgi:hypothetical protein